MSTPLPSVPSPLVQQLFSVEGHTVVITGGSGGLALALSRALMEAGASVALVDHDYSKLESTASMLKTWFADPENHITYEDEPKVTIWKCDISDSDMVHQTMQEIHGAHENRLDVLINTAGYCENIPATEYPQDKVEQIVKVNLNGSLYVAREFAKLAIHHGRPASIILIASMSGSIVNHPQHQTPYNMTKAGVIHLAKSLASEWASHHIRVNSLSPGYIATPLTKKILEEDPELLKHWESKVPLARIADPNEFIGPVLFMASNASSYMTGHDLVVDGGYTIW